MRKLLFCLIPLFHVYIYSQTIPDDDIIPICDGQSITTGAPGNSGINNITLPCNTGQPLSPYLDFYYIKILSGTTFTFTVDPVGNDDYDFAAYLNPNWSNLSLTPTPNKRGSQNDPFQTGIFHLGLSLTATDLCETGGSTGNPEPGMVRYFDVQPDDEILLAIDRWSQTTQGYTISFGGDAELDCTIVGNSYGKCDTDENGTEDFYVSDFLPDLNADYPGGVYEFYGIQSEAESGNGTQLVFPFTANVANNPTEVFVRVENTSGGFLRVVQIFLYVNPIPQITSPVELDPKCDSDGNGTEEFDLTSAEPELVTDLGTYTFLYYETFTDAQNGGTNNINPANAYESGTGIVYVRVQSGPLDGNEEGCFSVGEIHLTITESIESEFSFATAYCLDSDPPALPNVSDNGFSGTWVPAAINTSAIGTTTYTFTPDAGQCAAETEIEIEITEQIPPEFMLENSFCTGATPTGLPAVSDNGFSGTWNPATIDTSTIGTTTYTFTPDAGQCAAEFEIEIEITDQILSEFDLTNTFCTGVTPPGLPNVSDNGFSGTWSPATIDTSAIGTTTYTFTPDDGQCAAPFEIEIEITEGVLPEFDLDNSFCIGSVPPDLPTVSDNGIAGTWFPAAINTGISGSSTYSFTPNETLCTQPFEIEIEIFDGVELNENIQQSLCDADWDGDFETNLTLLNGELINNPAGLVFSYYTSQANAQNDIPIPQSQWNNYTFNNLPASIWVIATNADGCRSGEVEVEFIVGNEVAHNGNEFGPIEFCENEPADLTIFENSINPGNAVDFTYFETETDAQAGANEINNPETYSFNGASGTVYVRLDQPDRCPVILPVSYQRLAAPSLDGLPSGETLCGGDSLEVSVSSDDPGAVFQWTTESGEVFTGDTQTFTGTGIYSVVAIGANGCESEPHTFTISLPQMPVITGIESGNDYITVFAENSGSGPMEYSLDGILWQNINQFNNLIKGQEYTVYVRSGGCMVTSYKMILIDVPNFVSPNGDGYNDVWAIRGIDANSDSTIKIFDRNGKMLVDTNFEGNYLWDGKYGGRAVSSGDYWYIVDVPSDGVVIAKKFVGHISIRNQ